MLPFLLSLFDLLLPLLPCALFPTWPPSLASVKAAPRPGAGRRALSGLASGQIPKNCCARGMLFIAPRVCTASSRRPVARSSVCKVFSDMHLQKGLQPSCWRLPIPASTYHCLKHAVICVCFYLKKNKQQNQQKSPLYCQNKFLFSLKKNFRKRGEVHLSGRTVVHFPEKGIK